MSGQAAPGEQNIAFLLDEVASARPYQRALVSPVRRRSALSYAHLTFGQLRTRVDALAHGLRALGLGLGDRVSVFVKPGLDFPAVIFALFKIGAVPVFIDPGMGRAAVLAALGRVAPRGLIALPVLQAARPFFPSAFKSVKHNVTVGSTTGYWGGVTLEEVATRGSSGGPLTPEAMDPDAEAAILFTSGSTGPAKGARYTHRIYASQTHFIQKMYGLEPGEIDVPGLAVFGLFSLAMGMTVVWPEIDASRPASYDPARLVQLIADQGATNLFGGVAILAPLARYCLSTGHRLPSLRRVLSAGTAIPVALHERFREILAPGAEIHTPYGATEALPVASISTATVLGETAVATRAGRGTCVGLPAPGIAIRILSVSDVAIPTWEEGAILPPGAVGEICVSGPVVTDAYVDSTEATARAKIWERSGDRPVVWHRMGDLGSLDPEGRLWFCGRKAHRVETATGAMYSVPVEEIANQQPGVTRSALVGLGAPGSQEPVLVLELAEPLPVAGVAAGVRALLASQTFPASIQRVLFHASFPVDVRHNAKIHNEALAAWAAAAVARRPNLGLPGHEEEA